MKIVTIEEFQDTYIVVPDFAETGYGIVGVMKGDMTDEEWQTWNRARLIPDVKKILSAEPLATKSSKVLDYFNDKGVQACRTNQARPIF